LMKRMAAATGTAPTTSCSFIASAAARRASRASPRGANLDGSFDVGRRAL
jgi:hypothetical protein